MSARMYLRKRDIHNYDLNVSESASDTQGVARLNVISSLILVTPLASEMHAGEEE